MVAITPTHTACSYVRVRCVSLFVCVCVEMPPSSQSVGGLLCLPHTQAVSLQYLQPPCAAVPPEVVPVRVLSAACASACVCACVDDALGWIHPCFQRRVCVPTQRVPTRADPVQGTHIHPGQGAAPALVDKSPAAVAAAATPILAGPEAGSLSHSRGSTQSRSAASSQACSPHSFSRAPTPAGMGQLIMCCAYPLV